jgi:hypothetical protein
LLALPHVRLSGATSVNNAYFSDISRVTIERYFIPFSPRNHPAFVHPINEGAETCPNKVLGVQPAPRNLIIKVNGPKHLDR